MLLDFQRDHLCRSRIRTVGKLHKCDIDAVIVRLGVIGPAPLPERMLSDKTRKPVLHLKGDAPAASAA